MAFRHPKSNNSDILLHVVLAYVPGRRSVQHLRDSGAGSLAGSVTLELTESVMAVWLAADAALEAVAEVEMMVFNGAVGVLTAGGAREDQICTPISKSQLLLGTYRGRLDGSFHVCSLFMDCSRNVHVMFT